MSRLRRVGRGVGVGMNVSVGTAGVWAVSNRSEAGVAAGWDLWVALVAVGSSADAGTPTGVAGAEQAVARPARRLTSRARTNQWITR